MIKKAVLWIALTALIGFLVIGAVIRTLDKTGQTADADAGGGQGHGRNAQNAGDEAGMMEWLTREGTVVAVDAKALTVQLGDGDILVIEGRALAFSHELEFAAAVNDRLTLVGFDETGEFEVARIENLTTGQVITLRDEAGHPLWSGRGRRGA